MKPSGLAKAADLGNGFSAQWVWRDGTDRGFGIPLGAVIRHGACALFIAWAHGETGEGSAPGDDLWDLESLQPLTIMPGATCPRCGTSGTIVGGRWTPLDGEGGAA